MVAGLSEVAHLLRKVLRRFDPAALSGPECADVVRTLAVTEKVCAAARALAAARAVEEGSYRAEGFASGPKWLARHMGSTTSEARLALGTARSIEVCGEVKQALVAGEPSLAQANEIAISEVEVPGAEHDLVDLGRGSDVRAVRDAARERVLHGCDTARLYRRQRRRREFHTWRDRYGMVRLTATMPPDVGGPIVNRLDVETDRVRAAARRAGSEEPNPAHACDAFVQSLPGTGRASPVRSELVLVCDINAYRRGHAHPGEVCQVLGGGPLPVERVRELSEDAFVKAVFHDGEEIATVKHFGRHIKAELRTALDLGAPPGFEGTVCAEPGCGRRYGLEWDHVDPLANHGPTSYTNLQPRCWPHHREKTGRPDYSRPWHHPLVRQRQP
jgi:HNH endonuclease